jgi:HemY protein
MKKLFTILLVLGLTLFAAMLTPWLIKDPGYFYLRFAGYEIEMRFIVAFGIVLSMIFLFWLLVFFIRLPKKTKVAFTQNRSRKAFARGLLALSEGKWKEAEKLCVLSTKNSPSPELGYMAAARAAVSQNNIQQAFIYLDLAEKQTDNPLTVDLTRCELWVKLGDNVKAINLLNRILKTYPNNPRAIHLMTQASKNAGDWKQLRQVLPKAAKLEILPAEQMLQLSRQSIQQQLETAESANELMSIWSDLKGDEKTETNYILAYANSGFKLGMNDQVAKLLETTLNKSFSSELLDIWSKLDLDTNQKIKTAEKWLKNNSESPDLLRVLGQLCLQQQLWGKTQSYLQKSLDIHPTEVTYKLMAQYFDSIHETDNALEAYRQASKTHTSLLLIDSTK